MWLLITLLATASVGFFVLEFWQIALILLRRRPTFTILERQHADPSTLMLAAYH